MVPPPPHFNGLKPLVNRIRTHIQAVNQYYTIQDIEVDRWADILDVTIQPPAKAKYDRAIQAGDIAAVAIPPEPAPDAPAAARALASQAITNAYLERYTNRTRWLEQQYHGEREQRALRR